jgi:signal transduction histidine kinase
MNNKDNKIIKVLSVEDNPELATLMQKVLFQDKTNAFELEVVDCLSSGLKRLSEESIDILLLDLILPDSQGLDTFIRVHAQAPQIPIIVLTGLDNEMLAMGALRMGAQDYLIKGQTDSNLLIRTIHYAIERKRAEEETRLHENRLKNLLDLHRMGDATEKEIFDFTLEAGLRTVPSEFAFVGIISADEAVMIIHAWSRGAMGQCAITEKPIHFPIAEAGLWGEIVRQRRPIIVNDYNTSAEFKKGYPEGHVPIKRFLGIPIFSADRIVAVAAVANKVSEYTESDVSSLTSLLHEMWNLIDRKRAEEEKATLQEQLRQSQKIEAIGRLAGGIAHDFNNLLTVIKGYSQLSLIELKEDVPLRGNIEEIKRASEKAVDLTRQLLAFSRRQILEMRVLDLNTVLRDLDKMLRRVIGEDIELITLLADDLGRVKTDPGWVEQTIMNLAVNARDAMPSVGKLTIETANVELDETYARNHIAVTPGRYVMLSMSDTGIGMTPEVRQQVFEPFFTTKEKGKGTGLGLSTVYGIVKQSEGNIWVYSEPGKGTTFKIYLPRVDEPLEEIKERVVKEELPRGSETILLVEDEEMVRKLAVQILKRQGYTVLEGSHGNEAFNICNKHDGPIHLLVTDVVMPKMSGLELAERIASIQPEIKVLYMSGYTDNAITHHGVLEKGMNYIQKPFTVDGLARKVREVLDK